MLTQNNVDISRSFSRMFAPRYHISSVESHVGKEELDVSQKLHLVKSRLRSKSLSHDNQLRSANSHRTVGDDRKSSHSSRHSCTRNTPVSTRSFSDTKSTISAPPTQRRNMEWFNADLIPQNATEDVPQEHFTPSNNPPHDFQIAMDNLNSAKWDSQFDAINSIRQLLCYHAHQTISTKRHVISVKLLELVNNLRTSLSKNAILCLHDMFLYLGRSMDSEIEFIIPVLLKKTAETNRFLTSEVEKAFQSMVAQTNEEKVLTCLINFVDSKNSAIRIHISQVLHGCIQKMGSKLFSLRENGKIFGVIVNFLNDSHFQVRRNTRKVACLIYDLHQDSKFMSLEKIMLKHVKREDFQTFMDGVERGARDKQEVVSSLEKKAHLQRENTQGTITSTNSSKSLQYSSNDLTSSGRRAFKEIKLEGIPDLKSPEKYHSPSYSMNYLKRIKMNEMQKSQSSNNEQATFNGKVSGELKLSKNECSEEIFSLPMMKYKVYTGK